MESLSPSFPPGCRYGDVYKRQGQGCEQGGGKDGEAGKKKAACKYHESVPCQFIDRRAPACENLYHQAAAQLGHEENGQGGSCRENERGFKSVSYTHLPIIAMTANAFDQDSRKSLDSGMNGHLSKPIRVEELLRMLDACCLLYTSRCV